MKPYILSCFCFFITPLLLFSIGDPARQEAGIQAVYDQYNLSGEGVIIAMIDRGIDYRHPAFLNEDGTTRVAYIFDLTNDAGAASNPYGVGTIFNASEINAALLAGGEPLSMDFGGHGTASNSIACGNGAGASAGLDARGVAHRATIISIKFIQDPFPAGNGQAGQPSFFNIDLLDEAFQFIEDKAAELNMPVVTLMNFGSIGGPTDGTSRVCRAMDDFTAAGHLLVCGVGDDGADANSAAGSVPSTGESIDLNINKALTGNLRLDLWYDDSDRFDITVIEPDGTTTGPLSGPTNSSATSAFEMNFNLFHRGSELDFFGATTPRRELIIDISGPPGTYTIQLTGASITNGGAFQASLNPANFQTGNGFTSFQRSEYSINDYSAAFSVISPTDYVVDNTWVDIDGLNRGITGQGNPGEIWAGSSKGPTNDERLGIDFAAPGEVLYAAYSPNTFYSRFTFNTLQNSNGLYGIQNAVSAAAPLTTGVIALLLELKPDLSQAEVLDILQTTARQDGFTGAVPNNCWGYGKLDALAATDAVFTLVGTNEPAAIPLQISPNPTSDLLRFTGLENGQGALSQLSIHNVAGIPVRKLSAQELTAGQLDVSQLPSGTYYLAGQGAAGRYLARFIKL